VIYERRLLARVGLLAQIRREVGATLERQGVSEARVYDALVVLSELGTNAIHAATPDTDITVRVLSVDDGDIAIEVEDPGSGFTLADQLRMPNPNEEHGRGLGIVCLIADATEVHRRRRRTVVRALVRRNETFQLAGDVE
jgi:anti-sigma regulatory factor (Ser/Thr protein kinase)